LIDSLEAKSHGESSECEMVNIEIILNIDIKIDFLAG
jgi:hypothetical protein